MSTTTTRLPLALRTEMIAYLVAQEQPESAEEENQLSLQWNEQEDSSLIEAYNYNREYNGLPARQFEKEKAHV